MINVHNTIDSQVQLMERQLSKLFKFKQFQFHQAYGSGNSHSAILSLLILVYHNNCLSIVCLITTVHIFILIHILKTN